MDLFRPIAPQRAYQVVINQLEEVILSGKLEPGDKLLCFGKLEAMRGMIPARTQRKRLPVVQELDTTLVDVSDDVSSNDH